MVDEISQLEICRFTANLEAGRREIFLGRELLMYLLTMMVQMIVAKRAELFAINLLVGHR